MLLLFIIFEDINIGGVQYDENKRILKKIVESSISSLTIPSSVEEIYAGSVEQSAFYECRNNIKDVDFEPNCHLKIMGKFLFSETSILSVNFSNCNELETLPQGLFFQCSSLQTLTLPQNLKTIESGAITYTGLKRLELPDSLEIISDWDYDTKSAIGYNSQLKEIILSPNSNLTTIGTESFISNAIFTFYIPAKVASIKQGPWRDCPMEYFTIHEDNQYFSVSDDGHVLYNSDQTSIITFCSEINGSFTIPTLVNSIEVNAFRGSHLSEVKITNPLVINDYAFMSSFITSIHLVDGVKLGRNIFAGSNLKSIELPNSMIDLGQQTFRQAMQLENITLPETLQSIGNNCFEKCISLRYIEIPESVSSFGTSVFASCHEDLIVVFHNQTRFLNISGMVFYAETGTFIGYFSTNKENEIEFPDFCDEIPQLIFSEKALKSITFQERINTIKFGESAFSFSTLRKITLPSTLISIGKSCFEGCKLLEEIDFSNTQIETIPEKCFSSCTKLTTITLDGSNIKYINQYAFQNSSLRNCDFENSIIEDIGSYAFQFTLLTNIILPSELKSIGLYAFSYSTIRNIEFLKESPITSTGDHAFYFCSYLESFNLSGNIETISQYSFAYCESLQTIDLSPSTKTLEIKCFENCISLKSFTIPENSKLERIWPFVFNNCGKLSDIIVEDTKNFSYEGGMLMDSSQTKIIYYLPTIKTKTIIISGIVQEIAPYAFQSCTYIKEIIIPSGNLSKIGIKAFEGCTSLIRLILSISIKFIDEDAFLNCPNLRCGCVVIPKDLHKQSIEQGKIESHLLEDSCINSECSIEFDCKTCFNTLSISSKLIPLFSILLTSYKY